MSFFSEYSSRFMYALSLWPFVSLLLTLPIIAYLYHSRGKVDLPGVIGTYVAVLYVLGLVCFTLYPLPEGTSGPGITYGLKPQLNPLQFVFDVRKDGVRAVFQIVANVAFFVPLGFMGRVMLGWSARRSLVVGLVASLCIELSQLTGLWGVYRYSYRLFDVDDLVWNASGSVVGWFIAAKFLPGLSFVPGEGALEVERHPGVVRRLVVFLADMLIVMSLAYLLDFAISSIGAHVFPAVGMVHHDALYTTCSIAAFAVVQVLIPWFFGGRTFAGIWMRTSCERFERPLPQRLAFYVVRTVVVFAAFYFSVRIAPIALAFFVVARGMPYDDLFRPAGKGAQAGKAKKIEDQQKREGLARRESRGTAIKVISWLRLVVSVALIAMSVCAMLGSGDFADAMRETSEGVVGGQAAVLASCIAAFIAAGILFVEAIMGLLFAARPANGVLFGVFVGLSACDICSQLYRIVVPAGVGELQITFSGLSIGLGAAMIWIGAKVYKAAKSKE